LIGRLKLFSQLFETKIPASGITRAQNRRESFCQDLGTVGVSNPGGFGMREKC